MAVSINLSAILAEEKKIGSSYLTGRALESLAALLMVLGITSRAELIDLVRSGAP